MVDPRGERPSLDLKALSNDVLDCKRRSKNFSLLSELGSNTSCSNELLNRNSPSKEFSPSLTDFVDHSLISNFFT